MPIRFEPWGRAKEPELGTVSTHANADQLAVVWGVFFQEQFRPMGRNEGTMTYKRKVVFAPAAAEVQSRLPAAMQKPLNPPTGAL